MEYFLKQLNIFRFSIFIFSFTVSVTATALFFQKDYSSAAGQTAAVINSESGPHDDVIKKSQDILTRVSGLTKEIDQIDKDVKAAVLPGQIGIVGGEDASSRTVSFSKSDTAIIALIDSVEKILVVRNKSNRPVSSKSLAGLPNTPDTGAFAFKGGEYPGVGTTGAVGDCKDVIAAKSQCNLVILFDPKKGEGVPLNYDLTALRYRLDPVKFGYGVAGKNLESNALVFDGKAYLPSKIKFEQRSEPGAILVGDTGDFRIDVSSIKTDAEGRPFKNVTFSPLVAPFSVKANECVGDSLKECKILISFTPIKAGSFPLDLNISANDGKTIQEAKITLKGQALPAGADNDASKHVLVVYNEDWAESVETKNYYIANRPEFSSVNTLGVHIPVKPSCSGLRCLAEVIEFVPYSTIRDRIVTPIVTWLRENPDKEIQYIVLMRGLPNRPTVSTLGQAGGRSVQATIRAAIAGEFSREVFVTSLDIGSVEATKRYIDKLKSVYAAMPNKSPVISARGTAKAGTNYYFSDAYLGSSAGSKVVAEDFTNALKTADPSATIIQRGNVLPVLSSASNVSGFFIHGIYGYNYNGKYAIDGTIRFSGNSGWYVMTTGESFNGNWVGGPEPNENEQGNFIKWFSRNAFGGSNYENTPIAATTRVLEIADRGFKTPELFACWNASKPFAYCAWKTTLTSEQLQAVGDPWVTR